MSLKVHFLRGVYNELEPYPSLLKMMDDTIPVVKQLQIALWVLGNEESFRQIADRFDVSKSTTHQCLKCVVTALCQNIGPAVMAWHHGDCRRTVVGELSSLLYEQEGILHHRTASHLRP